MSTVDHEKIEDTSRKDLSNDLKNTDITFVKHEELFVPNLPGMNEAIDKRIKELEEEETKRVKERTIDIKKLLEEDKLKEKSQGASRNDLPDDLKDTDIGFEDF